MSAQTPGSPPPPLRPPPSADPPAPTLLPSDGLDLEALDRTFGLLPSACPDAPNAASSSSSSSCQLPSVTIRRAVADAVAGGLATVDGGVLKLTDPDGWLVSNSVISEVFAWFSEG